MQAPLQLPNAPLVTLRTVLGILIGLLVFTILVGYVGYQARFLLIGPQITLHDDPPLSTEQRMITLTGDTANITHLRLNGRQIFTDQDGHFNELVALTPGANIITIEAEDRYGRLTQVVRTVVQTE